MICVIQSIILFGIGLAPSFGKLPATGSVLPPLAELLLAMIVLSIVSMTLGLVISALVPTNEIAMPILVGITMVQVVLSGGVFAVASTVGLAQVAWLAPSFWGMNALASTADLNDHPADRHRKPIGWWDHTASAWGSDIGALIALAVVFTVIAWWRLGKLSPGRRK